MRPKLSCFATSATIAYTVLATLLLPLSSSAELPIEFKQCRAVKASGERVQGGAGRFNGDVLSYRTARGETVEIARDDLRLLDVGKGSKVGSYALAGAGFGALLSILAIIQVETDPQAQLDEDLVLPVTAGLIGVGTLIGAIVGSAHTEWTNVRLDTAGGASIGIDPGGIYVALRF